MDTFSLPNSVLLITETFFRTLCVNVPVEAINGLIYVYFIAHYLALENKLWGSSLEKNYFFSLWAVKNYW